MNSNSAGVVADTAGADRLTISIDDATKQSGLSRTTLYELMRSGELSYAKIGARRLIFMDDLRALLVAHRSEPVTPPGSTAP